MSLQIQVNLKKLYAALCPKCRARLLECAEIRPDRDAIKKALEA